MDAIHEEGREARHTRGTDQLHTVEQVNVYLIDFVKELYFHIFAMLLDDE